MATNTLGGRSLVAIGFRTLFTLGATPNPAPQPGQFEIEEPGVAGVLVLPQGIGRFLTSLRIRSQEMISGVVPFTLFASDNPINPLLGYAFDEASKLLLNGYSNPITDIFPAITATRTYSEAIDGISHEQAIDDEVNAFGRRPGLQLAIGPAVETTLLAAGADVVQQMVILKKGRLGHLHLSPEIERLEVVSVEIQSDGITNGITPNEVYNAGSFASPGFGHEVNTSTIVTITIRNNTVAAVPHVCACFTMLDADMSVADLASYRQGTAANYGPQNKE